MARTARSLQDCIGLCLPGIGGTYDSTALDWAEQNLLPEAGKTSLGWAAAGLRLWLSADLELVKDLFQDLFLHPTPSEPFIKYQKPHHGLIAVRAHQGKWAKHIRFCSQPMENLHEMASKRARWLFFLLIRTLQTFWATRMLILQFSMLQILC